MIRVVDYGVGNIQAFLNIYKRLGILADRASTPKDLFDATHLILPGVGAFDHAMHLLNQSGLRPTLEELVLGKKIPLLGVCVGMQMLGASSEEGVLPGLNWVPGQVRSFANTPQSSLLPMPHMGWNDLEIQKEAVLFKNFDPNPRFYFLHSYYFSCVDPKHVAARARYGLDFDCVVSNENIHGVQCHPEKSHHHGVQLLKNFAEI